MPLATAAQEGMTEKAADPAHPATCRDALVSREAGCRERPPTAFVHPCTAECTRSLSPPNPAFEGTFNDAMRPSLQRDIDRPLPYLGGGAQYLVEGVQGFKLHFQCCVTSFYVLKLGSQAIF